MNAITLATLLALFATAQVFSAQAESAQAQTAERPAPEAGTVIIGPCFARFVPERMDDFAWENDRIGFRVFGPALSEAEPGQTGNGVDVWVKRVREPIINTWYERGRYHRDHGEGLDYYSVGTTLGCGALGIWNGKDLDAPGVFTEHRVIQGEGDEIEFELSYGPWTSGDATVSEVKNIRMEKGSNFFEVRSTLSVEGAEEVMAAAGLVLREGGEIRHGKNWIAYAEPVHRRHGQTYTALILPREATFKKTDDHILLMLPIGDGETFAYRAGAAWDRGLDFDSPEAWFAHVKEEAARDED